jgi:phosphopantothenoylcysteine synthetase/decarboxylase
MSERMVYMAASGAVPREPLTELADLFVADGWQVTVICTPMGARFHDVEEIERVTGTQVQVDFRRPGTGQKLGPPDVMLACPWSFTSTNKTAAGIADTFAVALLCEMIGARVPCVVVPACNPPLADHPAFAASISVLRTWPGVSVLQDPSLKHPPWHDVLAGARTAAGIA